MTESTDTLYCYVHPNRPTALRCNRCERPICSQCAVRTPTGYRCRECVRSQQKTFDTAAWYDYLIGFGVTFVLSLIASGLMALVSAFAGFFMWFVSFAIAGGAGALIGNVTLSALRKHRSKALFFICATGVVAGALPVIAFLLLTGNLFGLIWQGIFVFVAAPTVFARVSGIHFTR
ncbi:MAG: hypothetical protein AB1564_11850 [Chloroflexota bacterium]